MSKQSTKRYLVVTDLDSSLLDEDYGYSGAVKALELMQSKGVPLVMNSSKTYAELRNLASELPECIAMVAENGGVVSLLGHSALVDECELADVHGYVNQNLGRSRDEILVVAHGLRKTQGYSFEGFADWQVSDVVQHTGLSIEGATQAMERLATEPIHWHGTDSEWEDFTKALELEQIRAIRGGRFIHLMGMSDKVIGMKSISKRYQELEPDCEWIVIAVGDSENDLAMLEAADIALVVPHHDGPKIRPKNRNTIYASSVGSTGWGAGIIEILTNEI